MGLGYDVFLVPAQPFVEPEAPRPGDPPSWSPPGPSAKIQVGKRSPNIGSPLFESASVASS